ncbi:MAG TPA: STAS domain-containing protein [Bryobacteraceae bacterium]|jgi:anti-anti-sigma regulatory factor|nr:STAS domain-containing protein [Bryobacteraceae bacterium]
MRAEPSFASMLKFDKQIDPSGVVTLTLAGKCSGGSLGELRRAIEKARRMQRQIIIDMSEVTLVDRPSLQFLAAQVRDDVKLINCPEYIEPWIAREEV